MTTTELIELLKKNEHGAITGKSREINISFNGEFIPNATIEITGTSDGICGADIDIDISFNIEKLNIIKCEAIYTGGNIWCFIGSLSDGTFFLASDLCDDVRILDTNPFSIEEIWDAEWQEEHLIKDIPDTETKPYFILIYNWLKENDPHCGLDFTYELSKERWT